MTDGRRIRTLIVDDEAPARRRVRTLLAREPDVELIGECADGPAAIDAIRVHHPDLLFLDVQMPEMNGFEVLRAVGADTVRAVVFVTAYDRYALDAFDAHALDYLLKPFANARFRDALDRARRVIAREQDMDARRQIEALLARAMPAHARIAVRSGDRITFLRPEEIDWIEGAGNYVRLHAAGESHLVRDTLKGIAARLDARVFLRVHHSHIVNVERIRELRPWSHGEYIIVLTDGTRLASSRSYSDGLRRLAEG
jgi:two-component system LytT family response regulator